MERHALKIEDFPSVRVKTFDAISETLQDFCNAVLTDRDRDAETLECRSRDGFIPYSHNKGGWAKVYFTSLGYIVGSGMYSGNDKFNERIDELVKYNREHFDRSEFESDEEYEDAIHEGLYDDYSSVMVKVQVMYNGVNNGRHTVDVSVMLEASDAPYHRGYDAILEKELTFKTVKELRSKLKILEPKAHDFIGNLTRD